MENPHCHQPFPPHRHSPSEFRRGSHELISDGGTWHYYSASSDPGLPKPAQLSPHPVYINFCITSRPVFPSVISPPPNNLILIQSALLPFLPLQIL